MDLYSLWPGNLLLGSGGTKKLLDLVLQYYLDIILRDHLVRDLF
jgi:hypothetical protein